MPAELDRDQKRHLRFEALRGTEPVPNVARLCGMNLYLHGIGPDGTDSSGGDHEPPIQTDDSLRDEPSSHADVVVTNPPFGKKSSVTIVNEEGEADRQTLTYNRPDFWTTTSNKQLNFVQHVKSLLKVHGRAAVVVPDNLFWLRDESLEDSASLPEPHLLAQEIADDLRAALSQIEDVLRDLEQRRDVGEAEE